MTKDIMPGDLVITRRNINITPNVGPLAVKERYVGLIRVTDVSIVIATYTHPRDYFSLENRDEVLVMCGTVIGWNLTTCFKKMNS